MNRHKFVPVARLPHRRQFRDIMSRYTKAYRVSDDPVWRNFPVLSVRSLDVIEISYLDQRWKADRYEEKLYPYRINGSEPEQSELVVTTRENNCVQSFKVSSYKSPMLTDEFDFTVHLTEDKRKANEMFASLMKQFYRAGDHVLVLDSPAGHTVNMLKSIIDCKHLHVANPDTKIPVRFYKMAQWHAATALEFIRDYDRNVPTHYWLDYCCTFDGCATQTLPQLDIEAIFCRGDLPRYNGVICLTFSMRGYTAEKLCFAVNRFMRTTAHQYGYKVRMAGKEFVYKRIVFLRFITMK
jgi:hypothetical protein